MKLCYIDKNNVKKEATPNQIEGNKQALLKSNSDLLELRGTFPIENTLLHYCFDEIKNNKRGVILIEHKWVKDTKNVELWYLQSSLLQTAAYQAFALVNENKILETATFFIKQGNEKQTLDITNKFVSSELHFGKDKYTVNVKNPKAIVEFYKQKLIAATEYDTAKEFDLKYKYREFEHLLKHFSYRQISK